MNNTIKSTLSNIYTVLCCVVSCIGVISIIAVASGIRPFVMISESMHPEVPKGSLVLLSTSSNMTDVAVGDNVAYVLGSVEAMHKVSAISPDTGENESGGEVGEKTLVVRSLADQGTSVVKQSTYLGRQVLAIPQVGGWIRGVLDYKWIVIGLAGLLIVAGCVPKKDTVAHQTVQEYN